MKISPAIQEACLAILCFDGAPEGAKFIRSLVPAKVMDPLFREIAAEAEAYLDKYGEPPGEHTADIVDALKAKDKRRAKLFEHVFQSIVKTFRGINRKYVIACASEFAHSQSLNLLATKILEGTEKKNTLGLNEAEAAVTQHLRTPRVLQAPGTYLQDIPAVMRLLSEEEDEALPTGIPELDSRQLGPGRGKLWMIAAAAKKGKSWGLLHVCRENVINGRRVLYISFELSERLLITRSLQSFFAMTKRPAVDLARTWFKTDDHGRFSTFKVKPFRKDRPSIQGPEGTQRIQEFLMRLKRRPKFLVKNFPMRSMKVRDLDAYLDMLEGRGFIPDLVAVDYPGIMDLDTKHLRESMGACVQDLRGLAQRRNVAIIAAHQLNRAGAERATADVFHISEDWSVVATVDFLGIYSQTDDERQLGLARFTVGAGREDEDRFTVLMAQNYAIGQFCLQSVRMSGDYWEQVAAETRGAEDEEEDDPEQPE